MKAHSFFLSVAALALTSAAHAEQAAPDASAKDKPAPATQQGFSTGVAKARDALDSATSTSTLMDQEIEKTGARSLGEIFRYIPGMRSEVTGGEGGANISIRGLPIALGGAKFLQLQENGLPTLEFGDIAFGSADAFLRADLNLAGVQAIRGGSASTFASNSPGGIVNLIDKTGTTEGGAIELSTGLDYSTGRVDFDYGGRLDDKTRFHLGGFYRQGEGPRPTGFDGYKGGQFKFNVTREFTGGYIRLYGKFLDDRTPVTAFVPAQVNGTNAAPQYKSVAGFDYGKDVLLSRYVPANLTLDQTNSIVSHPYADGTHSKVKSFGLEAQIDLSGWSVTERFRFSDISGGVIQPYIAPADVLPFSSVNSVAAITALMAAAGGTISYASGPQAGQVITSPTTLNGNGLLTLTTVQDTTIQSLDNATNDIRASKVWNLGKADLTFTAGFYKSSQDIAMLWSWSTIVTDVVGGGNLHLIDVAMANSLRLTQNGVFAYGTPFLGSRRRDYYDLNYQVNAPYASVNFHQGKIAIGGSLRYDAGKARGTVYGSDLLAVPSSSVVSRDMNGDGVIPTGSPETRVATVPLSAPAPLNYSYHYVSYSAGVNYRASADKSLFARISHGARANADRLLYSSYVDPVGGGLRVPGAAFDTVDQAEAGLKVRKANAGFYATAFWAKTREHNIGLDRSYRAYGVELESNYRRGIFVLNAGATLTKAKITADALVAANVGHIPKHQADMIFQITPQLEWKKVTLGVAGYGTTSSFAQDNNQLKIPGYAVFNGFIQYRPSERLTVSVNAVNMFNSAGIVEVNEGAIPANGLVTLRTVNPRTVSASVRMTI
jgi:outer membrane receptor protein involved in Fe transport